MPQVIQSNVTAVPPWLETLLQNLGKKSEEEVARNYYRIQRGPDGKPVLDQNGQVIYELTPQGEKITDYPQLQYAPQTQEEMAKIESLVNAGLYKPGFEQAALYNAAGTGSFPEHAEAYMNPYTKHVLENIETYGNRNLLENILPALESQFVGMGQHGSSRHADLSARAARDIQEGISREQRAALHQGYEHAGKLYQMERGRELEGAKTSADIGRMTQAGNLADIALMQEQAQQRQAQTQAKLDTDYQNQMARENFYRRQLASHGALIHGFPQQMGGSETSVTQTPGQAQPNTLRTIGNLAGALYGARMRGGFKKGGKVKGLPSLPKMPKAKMGLSGLKTHLPHMPKMKTNYSLRRKAF